MNPDDFDLPPLPLPEGEVPKALDLYEVFFTFPPDPHAEVDRLKREMFALEKKHHEEQQHLRDTYEGARTEYETAQSLARRANARLVQVVRMLRELAESVEMMTRNPFSPARQARITKALRETDEVLRLCAGIE